MLVGADAMEWTGTESLNVASLPLHGLCLLVVLAVGGRREQRQTVAKMMALAIGILSRLFVLQGYGPRGKSYLAIGILPLLISLNMANPICRRFLFDVRCVRQRVPPSQR